MAAAAKGARQTFGALITMHRLFGEINNAQHLNPQRSTHLRAPGCDAQPA